MNLFDDDAFQEAYLEAYMSQYLPRGFAQQRGLLHQSVQSQGPIGGHYQQHAGPVVQDSEYDSSRGLGDGGEQPEEGVLEGRQEQLEEGEEESEEDENAFHPNLNKKAPASFKLEGDFKRIIPDQYFVGKDARQKINPRAKYSVPATSIGADGTMKLYRTDWNRFYSENHKRLCPDMKDPHEKMRKMGEYYRAWKAGTLKIEQINSEAPKVDPPKVEPK